MQENKKRDMQKDGVDFLIKQGYKNLSSKTFISDIDLEKFLNKDFENINKTRALGFIQILEREYDVNLDELKSEYLEHETTHRKPKPETLFIEKPINDEKEWQKYLPYAAGAIAVLGLAFYLFRPSAGDVKTAEPSAMLVEENKSILKQAENNLDKFEANRSNTTTVISSPLESSLNSTSTPSLEEEEDDLDLDKVVLQMIKERNISVSTETNQTNTTLSTEQNKTVKTQKLATKIVKKEKPKEVAVIKTIPVKKPVVQPKKVEHTKKKKSAMGDLYIAPTQKAWVGVIYLDTLTKKDFLIRKKLKLDASRDQLIVVGHGRFKIYNKTYSVNFRSKGPVRFIYRDGELMEINKKEFLKTSEGVMW